MGEDHLYALHGAGSPDPTLERTVFGDIDGAAAAVVNKLLTDPAYALTASDKTSLGRFLVASFFRTPWGLRSVAANTGEIVTRSRALEGIDLAEIPFFPDETKAKFLSGDENYIRRNMAVIAVVLQVSQSTLVKEISKWPAIVRRHPAAQAGYVTSDAVMAMIPKGERGRIHIAPLAPTLCFVSSNTPEALFELQTAPEKFCHKVNSLIWRGAKRFVVAFPEAPYVREQRFVRGDTHRKC